MFDNYYTARLKRDLKRWVEKGLMPPEVRQAVLRDMAERGSGHSMAARFALMAGLLGAVLLSAGVLLFVGANWEEIPRLLRLALLLAGMWTTFGLFAWLRRTVHPWAAEAALLIGLSVFGGAIMLVSQMYHIHGHYPDGVLLWALGALLSAILLESQPAMVMTTILLAIWTNTETFGFGEPRPHWLFFPPWVMALLFSVWRGWRWGIHATILTGLAWFMVTLGLWLRETDLLSGGDIGLIELLVPFAVFAKGLFLGGMRDERLKQTGEAALWQGTAAVLLALFALQILIWEGGAPVEARSVSMSIRVLALVPAAMGGLAFLRSRIGLPDLAIFCLLLLWTGVVSPQFWSGEDIAGRWLSAMFMLGAAAWTIFLGQRLPSKMIEWLGMLAFGSEVLFLYFTTLGDMLSTSLFMLVGGVLFMGLAWGMYRLTRRKEGEAA